MARIRRTAVQTLKFKIEKAEERVSKTRAAHEKAIDDLKIVSIIFRKFISSRRRTIVN